MKNTDIEDITDHSVYVTTNNFNTFSGTIYDERLKQPNQQQTKILVQWDKNRERKGKLQTFVFSYFPDKNIFGDDCFQNMFIYQPLFSTLNFKKQRHWLYYCLESQSIIF